MSKDNRYRNWRFLVYPESAVSDWRRVLEEDWCVSGFISPLHSPDQEEGTLKEHYHVVLTFDGKQSYDQVKEIADSIGAVMYTGKLAFKAHVTQLRPAVRYLVHFDNQEKQHWEGNPADNVYGLAGNDPAIYFDMTQEEIDEALEDMRRIVRKFNITEMAAFLNWCDRHNKTYAHLVNTRFSNVMMIYIKSRRHSTVKDIDPETGEMCD